MFRALSVLGWIGALLTATLLVPYDDKAEPVRTRSYSFTSFEATEPDPNLVWVPLPNEWGAATQKVVLDREFRANGPATVGTLGCCSYVAPLRLDYGVKISPGTRWLNVTLDLKDSPSPLYGTYLEYRAANDLSRTVQLRDGATVLVAVDEEMNDWSPDKETRWTFAIRATGPLEGKVRIEIFRPEGPLPETYAFRERWGGAPVVPLFDQRAALRDAKVLSSTAVPAFSQPPESPRIRGLPPLGVHELRVILYYNSTTHPDLHYRPLLSFAGADKLPGEGWEQERVPPQVANRQTRPQSGSYAWSLPVEPHMWDSPFAKTSRWIFYLNWHGEATNTATYMDGDFHFRIEAVRESLN